MMTSITIAICSLFRFSFFCRFRTDVMALSVVILVNISSTSSDWNFSSGQTSVFLMISTACVEFTTLYLPISLALLRIFVTASAAAYPIDPLVLTIGLGGAFSLWVLINAYILAGLFSWVLAIVAVALLMRLAFTILSRIFWFMHI